MLRVAPWFALLLVGCEALSGTREAPGPAAADREAAGPAPIAGPAALKAAIAAGVRRLGDNEARFEVDPFVAALAVEELAGGAGGLRVEPALTDGAQVGYRLVEVTPGSAYAHLGLRAGDVIEAIGPVRLDGPDHAAGLLAAVGRGATLEVVRDGVGFSLEVRIAGGLAWAELLRARGGAVGEVVADRSPGTGPIGQDLEDRVFEQGPQGQVAPDAWPAGPRDGEAGGTPVRPTAGASGAGKPAQPAGTGKVGGSAGSAGSAGPAGSAARTGVQCASPSSCTLDRRVFDAAVANPAQLERQASISPARGGYKLTRVSPNSAVAALGFRAGDVIVSVNGARLDDEVAALGLYMGLGSTRSYNVTYERNGARASKSIALR